MKKVSAKKSIANFKENDFLNPQDLEAETGNNLLDSALHYARLGCRVFPVHSILEIGDSLVCSCFRREECTVQGKHPINRNGLLGGTTDPKIIRRWWRESPNANIGLLTGKASGFFVLDIDPRHAGEYTLAELEEGYKNDLKEKFEPLPATLRATTGSGGRHLYFKHPNALIRNSVSAIGAGLDIRGEGGYVVAPPSKHKSGNDYNWFGVGTPMLDAPLWLFNEIFSNYRVTSIEKGKASNVVNTEGRISEGQRHNRLWRHICGLVNGRTEQQALALALNWNQLKLDPPFAERYVEYQVQYLYRKYGGSTRMGLSE